MGDMADLAYEQMIDEIARGDVEYRVVCRYCGEEDLSWIQTDRGWRLFDLYGTEEIHTCPQYKETQG